MNIHVIGRQVEITPALHDYVVSKLSRITQRFDQVVDITVTLFVEKLEHKAEALVRVPGNDIFVEADSADMYASIDDLVDKLDRQLVRRKEKNESQRTDTV
ncbi:MAG TPA: ribosome-associated translation inhibitor RaiA [Nitrosospira sp.]|jgi:putative sigma-54 modulation protein|nr:ribosome-associated translation inhibitor RaiA [Nitrosospira sp.]